MSEKSLQLNIGQLAIMAGFGVNIAMTASAWGSVLARVEALENANYVREDLVVMLQQQNMERQANERAEFDRLWKEVNSIKVQLADQE